MSIVVLLGVIGIALLMLAIWTIKATRPDRDLLAPLEVMGQRRWRRSDPVWQRRHLDEVRPAGAEPLSPAPATPEPDAAFDAGPLATGFDDLPEDLAEVVATSLEAEVDHDATPPSSELPVVTRDTPPPAEPAEEVPLDQLGAPLEPVLGAPSGPPVAVDLEAPPAPVADAGPPAAPQVEPIAADDAADAAAVGDDTSAGDDR